MKAALFSLFLFCFISVVLSDNTVTPFGSIPAELRRFQSATGGFSDTENAEATTIATSEAISLSSLLYLGQRINVYGAQKFIDEMRRQDGGFANGEGQRSSIEATHAAVSALSAISSSQQDFDFIIDFLRATITPSGFAASQPGQTPSLQATVMWLELAYSINRQQDPEVQTAIAQLNSFLYAHVK